MEASLPKVFVTRHAATRLIERRLKGNPRAIARQVGEAIASGQASATAPEWYSGGQAKPTTMFVILAEHVAAIVEPNRKGRGYAVVSVVC